MKTDKRCGNFFKVQARRFTVTQ
ncbi:hypothetical protein EMIT0P12_40021 [Pseudomonas sp. IT-P12]